MKRQICFIVQRYGLEVNGGSELHCRQLAEHLHDAHAEYGITVLTSKAIEYTTWKDEYSKEEEMINGIHVLRFSVTHQRNQSEFDQINSLLMNGLLPEDREEEWVDKQGPAVPTLINYLRQHKDTYDVFIFMTYLYYSTVLGVREVADKAIVIPTAHDEPFLHMKIYDSVFKSPKGLFFNTEEERQLIMTKYHCGRVRNYLGGVGVDLPQKIDAQSFKDKYHLTNYLLYVGRIDEGKNCHILFQDFIEYKKRNKCDVKLVLIGKPVISIPEREDIISLGFLSDEDKTNGIAGAKILVLPSEFESLSMVVLEAMSVLTPVLVYGVCPVLKGHCIKSNGALYYMNFLEFEGCVNFLLTQNTEREILTRNAKEYVEKNFQWQRIIERLDKLIQYVSDANK